MPSPSFAALFSHESGAETEPVGETRPPISRIDATRRVRYHLAGPVTDPSHRKDLK